MKRWLALAAIAAFAVMAGSAKAADVNVGAGACLVHGGQLTRPAGSTIVIHSGQFESNRGNLQSFLNAQTTTLTVNGGPAIDRSDSYGAPAQQSDGTWVSLQDYPTGITLVNPGDTMTFTLAISYSRPFTEAVYGFDGYEPGAVIHNPAGLAFFVNCTVTAT